MYQSAEPKQARRKMWKSSKSEMKWDILRGDLKGWHWFNQSILGSVFKILRKPTRLLCCRDSYEMEKVPQTRQGHAQFGCKTGTSPNSHWLPLLCSDGWHITTFTRRPAEARILMRLLPPHAISAKAGGQPIKGRQYYCGCNVPPSLCAGQKAWLQCCLHNLVWQNVRLLVRASK